MADTIITVQGEYELKHPAERGAVRLSVAYEGEQRDETLALATQRHASLAAELRELNNPQTGPEYRTTMGLDPIGDALKAFANGDIRAYFQIYWRSNPAAR